MERQRIQDQTIKLARIIYGKQFPEYTVEIDGDKATLFGVDRKGYPAQLDDSDTARTEGITTADPAYRLYDYLLTEINRNPSKYATVRTVAVDFSKDKNSLGGGIVSGKKPKTPKQPFKSHVERDEESGYERTLLDPPKCPKCGAPLNAITTVETNVIVSEVHSFNDDTGGWFSDENSEAHHTHTKRTRVWAECYYCNQKITGKALKLILAHGPSYIFKPRAVEG